MAHEVKIGELVRDENQQRDAVHFAIAPVTVRMDGRLMPGQFVKFLPGSTTEVIASVRESAIGIIDPFLPAPVAYGDQCWMMLMPNTITSLRHDWEHPAFGKQVPVAVEDISPIKAKSIAWMKAWAMKHVAEDYYGGDGTKVDEDTAYAFALRIGHTHRLGPYEDARDHIDNEWWDHWNTITGLHGDRDEYFSCAC